jgi:hypothetical protein
MRPILEVLGRQYYPYATSEPGEEANLTPMAARHLANDSKSKPRPWRRRTFAKSVKHRFFECVGHTRPFIGDLNDNLLPAAARFVTHCDAHRPAAVDNSIVEKVMHHVTKIISVTKERNHVGRFNDHGPTLLLGNWQDHRRIFTDNTREINGLRCSGRLDSLSNVVSTCQIHQSINQVSQLCHLPFDGRPLDPTPKSGSLQPEIENGDRRTQLVGGIGSQPPLSLVSMRETLERPVDSINERSNLIGQSVD